MNKLFFTRSKWLLLTLYALLIGGTSPTWADDQTLTVYDGETTNAYVPVYGNYCDGYTKAEFVMPSTQLSAMAGGTIKGMVFYANTTSASMGNASSVYKVFLKEVANTSISAWTGYQESDVVYTCNGILSVADSKLTIVFDTPYVYGGGNLLIGLYKTVSGGSCPSFSFKGQTVSGASIGNGGYDSSITAVSRNFLPKTTFSYVPLTGPGFAVDGYSNGATVAFGKVTANATKDITLKNPGTESVTVNIVTTGGFTAATSKTIAAGGQETLTITAPAVTANGTITMTPTAGGVAEIALNLSCVVIDPARMMADFTGDTWPTGWTYTNNGAGWKFYEGAVYYWNTNYWYSTPTNDIVTTKYKVSGGDVLMFDAYTNSAANSYKSYQTLKVYKSTDGETWGDPIASYDGNDIANSFTALSIDNIPAGSYYFKFTANQICLDNIYGFLPAVEPKNLAVSRVGTTATFTWDAANTENAWQVYIDTDADAITGSITPTDVETTPSKTFTGLTAGSTYYVWVRSNFGGGSYSDWVRTLFSLTYRAAAPTSVDGNGITNVSFGLGSNIVNNSTRPTSSPYYGNYISQVGSIPAGSTAAVDITLATGYSYGTVVWVDWNQNYEFEESEVVYKGQSGSSNPTTLNATFNIASNQALGSYAMRIAAADSYYDTYISGGAYQDAYSCPTGTYTVVHDYMLQVTEAPQGAVLTVSTTPIAFGMTSSASNDITIRNTGAGQMTGLSVNYTATTGADDAITIGAYETTIEGNNQQVVTASVNSTKTGAFSGKIIISATDQTPAEIAVSGYTLDNTKILETFTSKPNRWTENSSWYSYDANGARAYSSERTLTTPKITVAADDVLTINARLTYIEGYVKIEGSTDNGSTWTAYSKTLSYTDFDSQTANYKLFTLDDIDDVEVESKKINKIRISGYYCYINLFNGFSYANDPILGLFSNEACTTTQSTPVTKTFGFDPVNKTQLYYIKNTGNGQIDLTIEQADGFTASVDDAALAEGEKATLTVTMIATEGLHDGTITVTAKNHDNNEVLGTFVVNANGGITDSKNNVVLTAFPAGWQNNNWTISNGAARNWSATSSDLITTTLTVTEGEKLLVEAYKYYSDESSQLSYSYSTDGGSSWSDPVSLTNQLTTSYKIIAISGIPAGNVLMKFSGTYTYIRQIYGFEAFSEPIMEFAAAGTTKNFGMITSKTTSDAYTITNSGTALLDNLSVTCDNANFEIAVADDATSIAAGSNVTFTVALKTTALGSQTGTVTISGDDVADKSFTVKGHVADNTKIFETFTAKPDRWTNTNNYWSFSANGATATSSSSKLESPKIVVAEGQKLTISAMQRYSGSSYYVTINGSSDNGATWTAYTKTLNNTQLNNTDYTVVELDDIPTTVNKLQLVGYYVYVNGLNGFTYDDNDPEFGVFSDALFASQITSGAATNAWGFVNEDKTATYYIKNTGTGTMTLSKGDVPAGFTATLGATSLGTGESTTLVIAMANNSTTNEGYHGGDVVLTAKDNADNTLGTFTVTSSGVVVGSKTDINFTTLSDFPAGWEANGWSVTENTKATTTSSNKTLTTGTYTVAAGEKLVIEGKGNYSWSSPTLTYQYSTDGGTNWTNGTSPLSFSYSATNYSIQAITDIPAGNVKIKFTGSYMDIQRIYGYTAVLEPVMALSPAATSYDFGMQTAAADYEITVTNSGTAAMENLTAALSGDDAADYEVALSVPDGSSATITDGKANVPVGQAIKVTATLKASTEYKTHNATLTISANDLADKVITLSGKTRDASKNYIDFASEIPSSFVEKGSWTVSSGAAYSGSSESSLISQPINLAAGEKIYFDAKKPSYGSPSLKVRYSVDGGISWSDYENYTAAISSTSAYSTHEIDLENASAVTAIVEFKGYYYMYIDNVYGGTLNNTASMIKVTKSAATVENGATEAFGSINAQATANYTITNVGNGTLTITDPVTKTGAATVTVNKTSLANNESATLTITMPVAAPYGYKEGAVTVETSLGDFVINYNATILNPNALDEQFASGKPAGWYFGGYWKVSGQQAMQEDSGTAEDLITEQLAVAGTSDVLTFQAARTSSYSAPTFKVYTSQNRVDWNEVDLSSLTLTTSYQDVNISGLAAGDYYVKISGARVKVDNFLGWTKKNNTRDLYVTATSFPTATTKGNDATITATVTSLIADETGVYAKLFVDGAEEATTDAQDIALNGTKTFSFTYAIPENKTAQIKVYYSDDTEAFATAVNAMKVTYAFDETVDPSTITAGTFNVSMTRTFNTGTDGWNTICLPFAMSAEQLEAAFGADAKAFEFDNFTGGVLSFQKVTSLTAATPYLIYLPDDVNATLSINDAVVSDAAAQTVTKGGIDFVGTYAPIIAPNMNGKWGLTAAGKIGKGNSTAFINGFRAYFNGSLAGARVAFFGDDDTTTGITLVTVEAPVAEGIYNLQGQKVENLKKGGLYIINGKKVVIK